MENINQVDSKISRDTYLSSFEDGILERMEMQDMDNLPPRDIIEYVQTKEYRRIKKEFTHEKLTQQQLQEIIDETNTKAENGLMLPEMAECQILACLSLMEDDYVLEKDI